MLKKIYVFLKNALILLMAVLPLAALSSCTLNIAACIKADARTEMSVKAELKAKTAALIKSLNSEETASNVLDAAVINKGLLAMKGIEAASLKNTSAFGIDGTVKISRIDTALQGRGGGGIAGIVTFESGTSSAPGGAGAAGGAGGKLGIKLNLENGNILLSDISEDLSDYVSALLAPIATGEVLTKNEYIKLVSSVYGKAIADEIAASSIIIKMELPSAIKHGKGVKIAGSRAELNLPLVDLLVLEKEIYYEVVW